MAKFVAVGKASPQRKAVKGICFFRLALDYANPVVLQKTYFDGLTKSIEVELLEEMRGASSPMCCIKLHCYSTGQGEIFVLVTFHHNSLSY